MKKLLSLSFILLMFLLAACATDSGDAAQSCPTATADSLAYANETHGYCLVYPKAYTVVENTAEETTFVIGDIMNHMDPRISIQVTEANGRSVQEAAAEILVNYTLPEGEATPVTQTIAGEEAIMIDNLPGQDTNRRVVLVHDGRLYSFFITPVGADYGETAEKTEILYQTVMESFSFLP